MTVYNAGMKTTRPRSIRAAAGLLAALSLQITACSHYVTSEIEIRRSIHAVDLPEPEIVESEELEAKRDGIRTAAVYLLGPEGRGNEIRELERSFVSGGLDVLEAREVSTNSAADSLVARTEADVSVLVYRLEAVDVTRAKITAEPVFLYGSSLNAQVPLSAEAIEKKARADGSMQQVVDDAKAMIERDDLLSVAKANAVLMDAKVIDGETGRTLLFYRAYTFANPDALDLGTNEQRVRVGVYKYKEGDFRPFEGEEAKKTAKSGYGNLSSSRSISGPDVQLKDERLQQVEQACNDLVETLKTPAALRY